MQKTLFTLSLFTAFLSASLYAAGDATLGKQKSASCVACHSVDGNSPSDAFPKIAGQHPGYLFKQLMDYKSGKRVNATMTAMVAGLNENDMQDLAAYFASQTMSKGATAEDQLTLGQTIYRAGNTANKVTACSACHGPTGSGNPQANFPRLNGQHAAYTKNQLEQFSQDVRANDADSVMRTIARKMTEEEIQAVAEYVQGLR